ncbi:hypothetical protein LTR85_000610 [Meristemomyces frigidus]|nr:hypothetical protein LTR85_000610 [Meristemomyces frigidus]
MYRPLLRQQTWTATGYVCRRCQHHLAAAQQQQSRHASTSTSPAAGADELDWFNSLSDEYGDRKKKRATETAAPEKIEEDEKKSPGRREREWRKRHAAPATATTVAGGQDFEEMRTALSRSLDKKKAATKPETAFKRQHSPAQAARRAARLRETNAEKGRVKEAAREAAKGESGAETVAGRREGEATEPIPVDAQRRREPDPAALAVGSGVDGVERVQRADAGSDAAVAHGSETRQKFEDIMAKLQLDVAQAHSDSGAADHAQAVMAKTDLADDVDVPAGLVSGEQSTPTMVAPEEPPRRMDTPLFSYSPASDAVHVPAGLVSSKPAKKVSLHTPPTRPEDASDFEQPEDTLLGGLARSGNAVKTFSFGKARKPPSLAERVQEAKDRPKWGGFSSGAEATKAQGKVSFESLRATDKVSKERVVVTAGELKAWGLEPSPRVKAVDGTRAEKAALEPEDAENETEKPTSAVGRIMSAMSSYGSSKFDALKQKLGSRVGKEDGGAVEGAKPARDQPAIADEARTQAEETVLLEDEEDVHAKDERLRNTHGNVLIRRRRPKISTIDEARAKHDSREAVKRISKKANVKTVAPALVETEEVGDEVAEASQSDDAMERLAKLHEDSSGDAVGAATAANVDPTGDGMASRGVAAKDAAHHAKQQRQQQYLLRMVRQEAKKAKRAEAHASRTVGGEVAEAVEERHRSLTEVMESHDDAPGSGTAAIPAEEEEESVATPEVLPSDIKTIAASDLRITPLNVEQPPVPPLQYGLDRVLFNPGVYQLQDPHSRVYNFDPYLQKIMPVSDFDFNALKEYKTSSQDAALSDLAKQHGKKYVGSTSSMTGTLGHFHYLLSGWRDLNLNMLSRAFPESPAKFTNINKAPNAIFLRWQNGTYAIDADKEYDNPNVLMMLGKSMEKLLTLPKDEFERYRKGSRNAITADEKEEPESYEYTTMGDFLMRSQLDAHDKRLPGTGMFDLKTRAVVSIRMDADQYESMLGYELHTLQGNFESYEREYYDMLRSTMLKYMLQARMGRMDGIFVAYHNVQRIFGFQYLPIAEMDRAIHGQVDPCLGDQEFRTSVRLLNEVVEIATERFPERSLRMHFEATEKPTTMMWVFAEPMGEREIEGIQATSMAKVEEFERRIIGIGEEEGERDVDETEAESSVQPPSPGQTAAPSLPTPASAEHTSTTTSADRVFIDHIATNPAEDLKPLFAATIICQNFVNGLPVDDNHVTNLKRHDKWEVQYILKEAQMTLAEKWARYEDVKTRRRMTFQRAARSEEGEDGGGEKRESHYIKILREMSARGREFRGKVDELEAASEKIVLGAPLVEGRVALEARDGASLGDEKSSGLESEERVASVDEYMRWLYSHQKSS